VKQRGVNVRRGQSLYARTTFFFVSRTNKTRTEIVGHSLRHYTQDGCRDSRRHVIQIFMEELTSKHPGPWNSVGNQDKVALLCDCVNCVLTIGWKKGHKTENDAVLFLEIVLRVVSSYLWYPRRSQLWNDERGRDTYNSTSNGNIWSIELIYPQFIQFLPFLEMMLNDMGCETWWFNQI
jgi:hypothetical protein